jgi:Protein of unknown function (DUF3274)
MAEPVTSGFDPANLPPRIAGTASLNSIKNTAPAYKARPLPHLTILIHGVNDVGVAYEDHDQGLCKGLNTRLNRGSSLTQAGGDLKSADYKRSFADLLAQLAVDNPARAQQLRSDPDAILFRRAGGSDTFSPVIPFYWGFREEGTPQEKKPKIKVLANGEWTDRWGNRLDKDGAKGGGPFVNATNSIPAMWLDSDGAKTAWVGDAVKRDALRPILKAAPRTYMILAAMRMARLIQAIRAKPEAKDAAINIMAHSQGSLISLLAQALLQQWGARPVDCLIMQHPPYAIDEALMSDAQTDRAKLQTLLNIVNFVHGGKGASPALGSLADLASGKGVVGEYWQAGPGSQKWQPSQKSALTFAERDNRGRVYLYFSPNDRTVQLFKVRGIGWQGVPDTVDVIKRYERQTHFTPDGPMTVDVPAYETLPAMNALKADRRFVQRVFAEPRKMVGDTHSQRTPEPVGGRCDYHYTLMTKEEAARWYQVWRATPTTPKAQADEVRFINGEALTPPCTPDLGGQQSDVDAIDASIAIASGRVSPELVADPFIWPDWRHSARHGQAPTPAEQAQMTQQAQQHLDDAVRQRSGEQYFAQARIPVERVGLAREKGKVLIYRLESFDELRARLTQEGQLDNPNSYHGGIPNNPKHHEMVSSYDLALGAPIPAWLHDQGWIEYLRAVADWRTDWKELAETASSGKDQTAKIEALKVLYWKDAETHAECKALVDATYKYHQTGILPPIETKASLVMFQTKAMRERNEPPVPFAMNPADLPKAG